MVFVEQEENSLDVEGFFRKAVFAQVNKDFPEWGSTSNECGP